MAGAWETQHAVLCAVLHVDVTTVAWAFGLRALQIPGPFPPIGLTGMPFDHARNAACMRALELGASHIYFVDSDVIPPRDAVLRLLAHDQPIIGGMYCRRSHPAAVPVAIKDGKWLTEFKPNSVVEVDLIGSGCLLIKSEVLEKLPPQRPGKHWFDWRVDMQGVMQQGECLSEDFTFSVHARRNGYKVFLDTSIRCRHVGYAEADFGSFQPMGA